MAPKDLADSTQTTEVPSILVYTAWSDLLSRFNISRIQAPHLAHFDAHLDAIKFIKDGNATPPKAMFLNVDLFPSKTYEGPSVIEEKLGIDIGLNTGEDAQFVGAAIAIIKAYQQQNEQENPIVFIGHNINADRIGEIIERYTNAPVRVMDTATGVVSSLLKEPEEAINVLNAHSRPAQANQKQGMEFNL